jgi:hypothetical protein
MDKELEKKFSGIRNEIVKWAIVLLTGIMIILWHITGEETTLGVICALLCLLSVVWLVSDLVLDIKELIIKHKVKPTDPGVPHA